MILPFESLLNKTATVFRDTNISDNQGGWEITSGSTTNIPVRVSPVSGSENQIAYLENRQITHMVYCLSDADVSRNDRLVIDGMGLELLVQEIRNPSLASHHLELQCKEYQRGSYGSTPVPVIP